GATSAPPARGRGCARGGRCARGLPARAANSAGQSAVADGGRAARTGASRTRSGRGHLGRPGRGGRGRAAVARRAGSANSAAAATEPSEAAPASSVAADHESPEASPLRPWERWPEPRPRPASEPDRSTAGEPSAESTAGDTGILERASLPGEAVQATVAAEWK